MSQPQAPVGLDLGQAALETQEAGVGAVGHAQGALAHGQPELVDGAPGRVGRRPGFEEAGVGLLVAAAADQDLDLGGRRGQDRGRRAAGEPGRLRKKPAARGKRKSPARAAAPRTGRSLEDMGWTEAGNGDGGRVSQDNPGIRRPATVSWTPAGPRA